jgi:hypothetical protein
MSARVWLGLQLAAAWLPMWALFTLLIHAAHDNPLDAAAIGSLRMVVPGALLGIYVYRFTMRTPWPHPFRIGFAGVHFLAALLYSACWLLLVTLIDSAVSGHVAIRIGSGIGPFLIMGVWLYIMVAGVAYANSAAQRAAQLEANATRMQLAELRAQLHPHFLFNAMHTIVQLIPADPRAATRAAEQLAASLRTTLEERRDLVPLRQEIEFVERYLAIERLRFGERLVVRTTVEGAATLALVPSFAVQTLVENAVRHGATPRVETTTLTIAGRVEGASVIIEVGDDGAGASAGDLTRSGSTGLMRLRERMHWLFGDSARLDVVTAPGEGFNATLRLPLRTEADDD